MIGAIKPSPRGEQDYRKLLFMPSSRAKPPNGRRSRGPPHVAEATEQVPPLRLAEPAPSEVEGLGSGLDDGVLATCVIPARWSGRTRQPVAHDPIALV